MFSFTFTRRSSPSSPSSGAGATAAATAAAAPATTTTAATATATATAAAAPPVSRPSVTSASRPSAFPASQQGGLLSSITSLLSLQTLVIAALLLLLLLLLPSVLFRTGGISFQSSSGDAVLQDWNNRLLQLEQAHMIYMNTIKMSSKVHEPPVAQPGLSANEWLELKRVMLDAKVALQHSYHMVVEVEKTLDRLTPPAPPVPEPNVAASTAAASAAPSDHNTAAPVPERTRTGL